MTRKKLQAGQKFIQYQKSGLSWIRVEAHYSRYVYGHLELAVEES
jgi:hypothetical protein